MGLGGCHSGTEDIFFSGVRGQDQDGAGGSPECHRLAGSKALLGHANGDITTHYSAAELNELRRAVEKIVDLRAAQTPTLTIVRKTRATSKWGRVEPA
jgi:hypothetical protein